MVGLFFVKEPEHMPNFKLIRRAKKELAQDGAIHADTYMMLMGAGIDPTMLETND